MVETDRTYIYLSGRDRWHLYSSLVDGFFHDCFQLQAWKPTIFEDHETKDLKASSTAKHGRIEANDVEGR